MEAATDQEQDVFGTKLLLDKGLVLYPIIVSAIAVSFDVGTFISVGLSWFSFFSLAEHLLFAVEALPIALASSFIALFILPVMMKQAPAPRQQSFGYMSPRRKAMSVLLVVILLSVILAAWLGSPTTRSSLGRTRLALSRPCCSC